MKLRIIFGSIALLLIPFSMNAATISPATLDLQASRGETIASSFTVINTSAAEQKYFLDTLGFKPRDESGTPQFVLKEQGSALIKWIQFPSDHIVVPAQSKLIVPFQVVVPADVASGNQEAAITVSSAPSDVVATNGAIIEAKTAVLVFLTIKGETKTQASLLDFVDSLSYGLGPQTPRSQLIGNFSYRIQNQGNVYAIPSGTIQLKDVFGRMLSSTDANSAKSRVLPSSTRRFEVAINDSQNGIFDRIKNQMRTFAIGPVTAELSLDLGAGFSPIHAQTTFWYIPLELIGITILGLIVIVLLVKKFRSHARFSAS